MQVHRELTKKFEEHIGDNIEEVNNYFEKRDPWRDNHSNRRGKI